MLYSINCMLSEFSNELIHHAPVLGIKSLKLKQKELSIVRKLIIPNSILLNERGVAVQVGVFLLGKAAAAQSAECHSE